MFDLTGNQGRLQVEFYMTLEYGRWYMPSRRPTLGPGYFNYRYDFGKSESEGKSQQETRTAGQTRELEKLLNIFGGGAAGPRGPVIPPISGVEPLTTTQRDIFSTVGDFATGLQPLRDTSQIPLFEEATGATSRLLSGDFGAQPITPEQTQDFFERAIAAPARFSFEDIQRPLIREEFAGPGFSSSARAQEVVRQGETLERGLGEARAGLEFEVLKQNQAIEQQKAANALSALPAAEGLAGLPENIRTQRINDAMNILNAATFEQLQNQAVRDEEIERFTLARDLVDPRDLSILLSLLNLNFGAATSKSSASSFNIGLV